MTFTINKQFRWRLGRVRFYSHPVYAIGKLRIHLK